MSTSKKRARSTNEDTQSTPAKRGKLVELPDIARKADKYLRISAGVRNSIEMLVQLHNENEDVDVEKRNELLSTTFLKMIMMKDAFRELHAAVEEKKELAGLAKLSPSFSVSWLRPQPAAGPALPPSVSDSFQKLQAVQYERNFIAKEIEHCTLAKFAGEGSEVDLVPMDEFVRAADKYIPSGTTIDSMTEHELYMKRLEHELDQRKALEAKLSEIKNRKRVFEEGRQRIHAIISKLREKAAALDQSAQSIQQVFKISVPEQLESRGT